MQVDDTQTLNQEYLLKHIFLIKRKSHFSEKKMWQNLER